MSKPSLPIHLVSYSPADRTTTFLIAGKRWHYLLRTPPQVDTIAYLARRVSAGKALAYAKRHSLEESAA